MTATGVRISAGQPQIVEPAALADDPLLDAVISQETTQHTRQMRLIALTSQTADPGPELMLGRSEEQPRSACASVTDVAGRSQRTEPQEWPRVKSGHRPVSSSVVGRSASQRRLPGPAAQ